MTTIALRMHSLIRPHLSSTSNNRLVKMCSHLAAASTTPDVPFKELRIPVPWGHIAAKEWGKPGGHPVLGLHGWQDNCGSFDPLIPLLSPDLHIVAVDLPGHGLSSHKPPGMLYHVFDWIADVHRIVDHLKWEKFSFLAHSMGVGISFAYAGCFPDKVLKLVALDGVKPYVYPIENLSKQIAKGVGQLMRCEAAMTKTPRPLSTDEAVEILVDAMQGSVTEESAHILLKRGATPAGDSGQVIFTRDSRLKVTSIPGVTNDQLYSLAKKLKCETLLIVANQGLAFAFASMEELEDIINMYKKGAKSFNIVKVDGTHHVHLNNPEVVAPPINTFFSSV